MPAFVLAAFGVLAALGVLAASATACEGVGEEKPRITQVAFPNSEEIVVDHQHEIAFSQIEKEEAESRAKLEREGKELAFEELPGVEIEKPKADEESVGITEVAGSPTAWWESTYGGEMIKDWPVSDPGGATLDATAQFGLDSVAKERVEDDLEGSITFTGETTVEGVKLTFTDTLSRSEVLAQLAAHSAYLASNKAMAASAPLPESIFSEQMDIDWKWSITVKGHGAKEESLGESTLNLYVMYKPAKPEKRYLTLTNIVTKAMKNARVGKKPTQQARIKALATEFATKTLEYTVYDPRDGKTLITKTPMRYYANIGVLESLVGEFAQEWEAGGRSPRTPCNDIVSLLVTGEGRCGVWAQAFSTTLEYAGVGSEIVSLRVKFPVGPSPCTTLGECILLVKNWEFPAGGKPPYKAAEVKDQAGVSGQGVANPPGYFWDHAIVKVKPTDGSGPSALYDPSYGAGPFEGKSYQAVLELYEGTSLEGYCWSKSGKKFNGKKLERPAECRGVLPAGEEGLYAEESNQRRQMVWP